MNTFSSSPYDPRPDHLRGESLDTALNCRRALSETGSAEVEAALGIFGRAA